MLQSRNRQTTDARAIRTLLGVDWKQFSLWEEPCTHSGFIWFIMLSWSMNKLLLSKPPLCLARILRVDYSESWNQMKCCLYTMITHLVVWRNKQETYLCFVREKCVWIKLFWPFSHNHVIVQNYIIISLSHANQTWHNARRLGISSQFNPPPLPSPMYSSAPAVLSLVPKLQWLPGFAR